MSQSGSKLRKTSIRDRTRLKTENINELKSRLSNVALDQTRLMRQKNGVTGEGSDDASPASLEQPRGTAHRQRQRAVVAITNLARFVASRLARLHNLRSDRLSDNPDG
ncbi:hypothetical protein F0562_009552 [Nyssa sinensis]|uniref:Uncharacterized protein n=1 Tax=Nyssa sinensis TaxID=561372 RepID=A0A5J4ZYL6_9ASTE|nr:hypothetical protein F0562_009552 [Nyssa sinensis]